MRHKFKNGALVCTTGCVWSRDNCRRLQYRHHPDCQDRVGQGGMIVCGDYWQEPPFYRVMLDGEKEWWWWHERDLEFHLKIEVPGFGELLLKPRRLCSK